MIAEMVRGKNFAVDTAISADSIQQAIIAAGQPQGLNRAQLGRLIDSLGATLLLISQHNQISVSLAYAPRKKTVGPWWLETSASIKWAVDSAVESAVPTVALKSDFRISLSREKLSFSSWEIALRFANAEGFVWSGLFDDAIEALSEKLPRGASREAVASWNIKRARTLQGQREFKLATDIVRQVLKAAQMKPARLEQSQSWVGYAKTLLMRIEYAQDPVRNAPKILQRMLANDNPASNTLSLSNLGVQLNLAGLCMRRDAESKVKHMANQTADVDVSVAFESFNEAVRLFGSAYLCYITENNFELAQQCCANAAFAIQRSIALGVTDAYYDVFGWYMLSGTLQNKFSLADNSAQEFIFIGDFWLYTSRSRAAFEEFRKRFNWQGYSPNTEEFYRTALATAERIGDPLQALNCALNLYWFLNHKGTKAAVNLAMHYFADLVDLYPQEYSLLIRDGYEMPPKLAAF